MVENTIGYNGLVFNDRDNRGVADFWFSQVKADGLWDSDIRDNRIPLPGQHGETSWDSYYAGKTVTLAGNVESLTLAGLRRGQRALQLAFSDLDFHRLEYTMAGESQTYLTAKKVQMLDMPESQDGLYFRRPFVVAVRADDPRSYSTVTSTATISSFGFSVFLRTYTAGVRTYPRTYTSGVSASQVTCHNAGTAESYPTISIYGQAVNPRIINLTTGEEFGWSSRTIANGDYAVVHMRERTIFMNGLSEIYTGLDVLGSTYFALVPGDNEIAVTADSYDGSAHAVISWQDAYR